MPELTVGRIVRVHATVLGVLLATGLPAFTVSGSAIAAVDDSPILACLAVAAGSMIRSKARELHARWRSPGLPQPAPGATRSDQNEIFAAN